MATVRKAQAARGLAARLGDLTDRTGRQGAQTKGEFALEVLRSSIIDAEFQPGQRLHIEELADTLQVSETPIREALRRLQVEGLVRFLPHRGVLVAETNPEELRVVFLIREALETLAVRLAVPRMSSGDLRKLHQIHRKLLKAGERNDPVDFRRYGREFHVTLYQLAGSEQLFEFLRILWAKSPADLLLRSGNLKDSVMRDHGALLAALDAGQVEEAVRLTLQHLENGLRAAQASMEQAAAETANRATPRNTPSQPAKQRSGRAPVARR